MLIDSHTHLNMPPLVDSWREYWDKAQTAGVGQLIVPGIDLASSRKAVEIAESDEGIFAAIGIHPDEASATLNQQSALELKNQIKTLAQNPKVVALGECGLDYYHLEGSPEDKQLTKLFQQQLFQLHLELGQELNLPLTIHIREAHTDTLDLIEEYNASGVLHCFSGNREQLERALELGLFISFAGNLTFKNARELQELLPLVPLNRLLLETDAPYLNPERGQFPNHPAQVRRVYESVARQLGLSIEDLALQVEENAGRLFQLKFLTQTYTQSSRFS